MDITDVIYKRRSVRKYKEKPVERADIERMIAAAVQAPSAMNSQPWVFGVIQDNDVMRGISDRAKAHLVGMLDRIPALEQYRAALESPEFNIFYNAPALVVICAKPNVSPDPKTDCSLAAENLMLMAYERGLGTCWIGFANAYLNTSEGRRELGIPEDYSVIAPIIVGHPVDEETTKERNPPEMLFWK